MKQLYGKYEFASGVYSDGSTEISSYTDGESVVCIAGRLNAGGVMNDGESVLRLFRAKGLEITKELTGLYIAVIYDGEKRR